MSEKDLEQYFDILTQNNSIYSADNPLSDDKLRFELYASLNLQIENADLDYLLRNIVIETVIGGQPLVSGVILSELADDLPEDYNPEEIELVLSDAMSGIIAKDKKMIETLRQLKMGITKENVAISVQKPIEKPKQKSIKSIVKQGKIPKNRPEKGVT